MKLIDRVRLTRQMWRAAGEAIAAHGKDSKQITTEAAVAQGIASSLIRLAVRPMLFFIRETMAQGPEQTLVTTACCISGLALEHMNAKPISIVQAAILEYGGVLKMAATHRSYVAERKIPGEWKEALVDQVRWQLEPDSVQPPV